MKKSIIFDIQKFSVHDGPGIRTILFFKGCPLECKWCANPESQRFIPDLLFFPDKCIGCGKCIPACTKHCITQSNGRIEFDRQICRICLKCTQVCHSGARIASGTEMTVREIIEEADKDMIFYKMSGGGITFSGGEAMCVPEVVAEIAAAYKERGISTALETCGHVPWESYERVLPYIDVLLFDLKLMDDERHLEYVGCFNDQIVDNLKRACKMTDTIVRIPIIPSINDSDEDIKAFGTFLETMRDDLKGVNLLPYHDFGACKYTALGREYSLHHIQAPADHHMEQIKAQLETYGLDVKIGG